MSVEGVEGIEKAKKDIGKKTETIKGCIIVVIKESLKFALMGVITLLSVGFLTIYILLKFFQESDGEIIAMIAGIEIAIIIFIIDIKKLHTSEKMSYANCKMFKLIIHKISNWKK